MNYCRASLTTLKKLMKALSDSDPVLGQELARINDATLAEPFPAASSTTMALSQLGLIDRAESGNNLSV